MGKRKHFDGRSRSDARSMSTADILHRAKRARTNSEEGAVHRENDHQTQSKRDNEGEGGWQTVDRKARKHKHGHHPGSEHDGSSQSPRVYFHGKADVQSHIRLEDLRDLVLYVLADGVGPSWVAVDKRKSIKKVVTVMVPGMDQSMIDRACQLLQGEHGALQGSQETSKEIPGDVVDDKKTSIVYANDDNHVEDLARESPNLDTRSEKTGFDWLTRRTFAVRGPGDSRQLKVHSPLHAMIMKGHDTQPNNRKHNDNERPFSAVKTPITEFIHTTDELQEADYPVHPALFTSRAHADLEATRRQATQQASQDGWLDSDVNSSSPTVPAASLESPRDFLSQGLDIYAIDCEMVLTSDERSSLARISVVSWPDGKTVLDKFVKPDLPITNYFTQYSGITAQLLEGVETRLSDIQAELKKILTPSTIILGHSLESDLNAIKMTHPFIVDTSMIYPHPRGLPLRSSLKFLANKYLRREIQKGGANGHDSVEDARAVLDLVKLKCEKGPRWGTSEALGETIFRKLAQAKTHAHDHNGRAIQSAIVEYGTPERGFGRDATFATGCQNDDEIVAGILRSTRGDPEGDETPQPGVNYVWARLRALEFARGWVTTNKATADNNNAPTQSNQASGQSASNISPPSPFDPTPETDAALLETVARINQIRARLPKNTLLILCSGTSDMRMVTYYQGLQAQYRREFKVKKWDELTVRWTDAEEQELRKAVEKARRGWGWIGVV